MHELSQAKVNSEPIFVISQFRRNSTFVYIRLLLTASKLYAINRVEGFNLWFKLN